MTIRPKALHVLSCALALTAPGLIWASSVDFDVLHTFDNAAETAPNTYVSPTGSQPDTLPVLGPDHTVYGMTYAGGVNGNGVIYKYDLEHRTYSVIHTFSALDAAGNNEDGAGPGVALTRGPDDVFYGNTSAGGANGNGTVFKITTKGKLTVLHAFSATDSNGFNHDGAAPLRAIVIGRDGNLYGTTRVGGIAGLGVAWMMSKSGAFNVLHEFTASDGHAASLLLARDGFFYGCGVYPIAPAGSGTLYRMDPSGHHFEILYRFSPVNKAGANEDGADCYEPLIEHPAGVFYGTARYGGSGNGVVFRYSLSKPNHIDVVHNFGACETTTAVCENTDGANPYARLTLGDDGEMYSTASYGGPNGSGVVFRVKGNGAFKVLYAFSAQDPNTGANRDGANPDFGVILGPEGTLIGMADAGGLGNATYGFGNGTLYQLNIEREDRD